MGFLRAITSAVNRFFGAEAERRFLVDTQQSAAMEALIDKSYAITGGHPPWEDPLDGIRTIGMAGQIDDIAAGLVTLGISIDCGDGPVADVLQARADYVLEVLTDKVSEALGNAGIMLKPAQDGIDYYEAGSFAPTETDSNGKIRGCVFQTRLERERHIYTRLEWHHYEPDGTYHISNAAYKAVATARGMAQADIGTPCELTEVAEWAEIEPDVYLSNIESPLFAYFGNPAPNRIDRSSPLSVPIWTTCLTELEHLDIAWSRKADEIADSKHVTFLPQAAVMYADSHDVKLPRYIRGVEMGVGVNSDAMIHEHVPTIQTDSRIKDINSILAMISTKCGFSQGFFQLDEKTGLMTATQVEADDQETVRTIKNIRDALQDSLTNLLYACYVMDALYNGGGAEAWETVKEGIVFDFDDITYNYEEDRKLWWTYRLQGDVPAWLYYSKFEGMSEDDAKAMIEEAKPENILFSEE